VVEVYRGVGISGAEGRDQRPGLPCSRMPTAVARCVIAQMVLIERQRDVANGAIDLQKAVLRQATADKRAVGGHNARRSDPARMAASLVESWVGARLAATQRKISIRAFERIDAVIWQFIADTIDPAEIQALLGAQ